MGAAASPKARPVAMRSLHVDATMSPMHGTDIVASPKPRPLAARLAERFDSAGMPMPSLLEGVPSPRRAPLKDKEQPLNPEGRSATDKASIEDSLGAIMEEPTVAHSDFPKKR